MKKRKIKQLQGLCTQYEYELSQFKYWKKVKEEHEVNNARNERYPLPSPEILDTGNYIILDEDNFTKIEKLGVESSYRKKGIATYLLNRTISWGKENGLSGLYLTASASTISYGNSLTQDELIQFYKNLGFQQCYDEISDYLAYYYDGKKELRWI